MSEVSGGLGSPAAACLSGQWVFHCRVEADPEQQQECWQPWRSESVEGTIQYEKTRRRMSSASHMNRGARPRQRGRRRGVYMEDGPDDSGRSGEMMYTYLLQSKNSRWGQQTRRSEGLSGQRSENAARRIWDLVGGRRWRAIELMPCPSRVNLAPSWAKSALGKDHGGSEQQQEQQQQQRAARSRCCWPAGTSLRAAFRIKIRPTY
jgi:hypothetical protein